MAASPLRLLPLLPWLLAFVAGTAAAGSATLDRIRETGSVTLAYREGAAPFSFADRDGRVRGYSVEVCHAVVASIQQALKLPSLKIAWIPVTATTRLDAVRSGRADAECGTTTITLTRMAEVDFSLPIFVDGGTVLTRTRSKIGRLADLKGRRIAVMPGTTTEQALVAALNLQDATATLVPVPSTADGIAKLAAQDVDGFAADRTVLARLRAESPSARQLALLTVDFSYEPYGIVLRRDDPDFRLAVNRALVDLYKHGGVDPIYQRWLAPLGRPGPMLHAMFYLNSLPE
jgi:ABC-type amino acid transport substrate-binding protein